MATFVSLFRAINVGGNHKVKMDALKVMHEALGFTKVTTYLQTGNVVFEAEEADTIAQAARLEKEFVQQFGFRVGVVIRTADELRETFERNPFVNQAEKDTKWLAVMFLSAHPDEQAESRLRQAYNGPEELFLMGKDLYIYYPDGVGRSKLTNALIEKHLKVIGTGRNWNTVTKLMEMTQP